MTKYNLSEIMKRAWEIKKENESNIFAFCLKKAWSEAKVANYLLDKGLKVWEGGSNKRIYINDFSVVGIERFTPNPKSFKKATMYYDLSNGRFYPSNVQRSNESTMDELIAAIRAEA